MYCTFYTSQGASYVESSPEDCSPKKIKIPGEYKAQLSVILAAGSKNPIKINFYFKRNFLHNALLFDIFFILNENVI